ncbi:hypothetical protein KIH23_12835 [Flavobacterium sp. CYK-55]|uniref:M1 family aminopeptidase n=1 Tax=Flavobacterium sp. CYK-55 TaxID=2835529 RepID=UPI001BCBC611|nr:M1 family aminopeptidase [Flavobacterium sp. CYK-55]MBS7788185.1 hypothetical protein [Flavobacterium sp. CYK-55]
MQFKIIISFLALLNWPLFATNINSNNIDVIHSKIELSFDWSNQKAIGKAYLNLKFTKKSEVIFLAAKQLKVHSVQNYEGINLNYKILPDLSVLQIQLNRTYSKDSLIELIITYETQYINRPDLNTLGGSFGSGLRFFEPTRVNPLNRKQIWSQSQWNHSSYWHPCSLNPHDLSTSEFIATVDEKLTLISNGQLIEVRTNEHKRTFHYRLSYPHVPYLNEIVVGEYVDYVQYYKGIPLHTYGYPDELEAIKASTVDLPKMMQFLNEKTGFDYPFESYTQVVVQNYPFPGKIAPSSFGIISDNMIDDAGTHEDYQYLWDGVSFNALASQWFGSIIIPKKTQDIWLSQAFAQFFEGWYTAQKHGQAEYLLWYLPWETGSVQSDWDSNNKHAIVPNQVEDAELFTSDSYAKYRGALVLRMLRDEIGEENFLKAIRYFIRKNAFKPVTTTDFETCVNTVCKRNLSWFFKQWLYQIGQPNLDVSSVYFPQKKQFEIRVRQSQSAIYFQGTVNIEINGEIHRLHLNPQPESVFIFSQIKAIEFWNFDPYKIWIGQINQIKSKNEWLSALEKSNSVAVRNDALNELSKTVTKETTTQEKSELKSAYQKMILSDAYWRLRLNAVIQLRNIESVPDENTQEFLVKLIGHEKNWVKAAALTSLGLSGNMQHDNLYVNELQDYSDRVVSAAAIALGKSKSPKAFDVLAALPNRPSWKNQSLMHALSGLTQLGDSRAEDIALTALKDSYARRWFLGNGWDFPVVAVQSLKTLNKTQKAGEIIKANIQRAIDDDQPQDIIYQLMLLMTLTDAQTPYYFNKLKELYKTDSVMMSTLENYEQQWTVNTK